MRGSKEEDGRETRDEMVVFDFACVKVFENRRLLKKKECFN